MSWAECFEKRTWAIESSGGLGYLLAQQLVARGEEVLDVPATLASRIRVLATERSNKNDPNDAHSIAIAALRSPRLRSVEPANHAEVLRLLAKRNHDIGVQRIRTICRLRRRAMVPPPSIGLDERPQRQLHPPERGHRRQRDK
jgi:transposase